MAGEWAFRKLADLCDSVDYGYTTSAKDMPCGPKFLRITDIVSGSINWDNVPFCEIEESSRSRFRLHDGDVVIARTGATTGYSAYLANPPDAVFASYLVRLKIGREADSHFISYFLKSPEFWSYMRGVLGDKSAQPNASAKTITQVTMALPPLNTQQAIARILGSLDDKIELNLQMNKTLEATARAVFKSWFLDFDPVRAKADGRETHRPKAVADLFPDSFQDAELGEIPKGWAIQRLSDMVAIARDTVNPADFPDEAFYHYSIPAYDESRFPSEEVGDAIKSGKFIVSSSSILISKLNPRIPRIWMHTLQSDKRSICSTEFLVAIPKVVSREYLYCLCSSPDFVAQFTTMVTGTSGSHQRVKAESFLEMKAIMPPMACVEKFTSFVAPLFRSIANNILQARSLAAIRDALLPKLLSGEVRVKDVEKVVDSASHRINAKSD